MPGDDEILTGQWQLDPGMRLALRLKTTRAAADRGDWPRVVLEAEELLDEDPQDADALLLLGNALLELGDAENAADVLEDHLRVAEASADVLSGLALARFEMCDLVGATEAAREALRLDGSIAEAHYTLALAAERQGARDTATRSLQAAHALDPANYPLPLDLHDEHLELALRHALPAVPPQLVDFWRDVPIAIEEEPSIQELLATSPRLPPTVGGLYAGTPPEGDAVLHARPEALRLFRRNLARAGSLEAVARQLALILEQEALDWLGAPLDELV